MANSNCPLCPGFESVSQNSCNEKLITIPSASMWENLSLGAWEQQRRWSARADSDQGLCISLIGKNMSCGMRFPTMWYVRPAKPQISLRILAVQSEPLLVAWIFYDYLAFDWKSFGVFMLKRRLHRLIWVYTSQNATLLEITCGGSYIDLLQAKFHYSS